MAKSTTMTNLRLPEELYERIRELAERERRSINSQMIVLLEEAIEAKRPSAGRWKHSDEREDNYSGDE